MAPVPAPLDGDVGAWLRDARQQSGVSLRQIADTTKLSVYTLQALEGNRLNQLPEGIYRRGVVRAYASEIGLDPESALRAFLANHPQDEPPLPRMTLAVDASGERRVFRTVVSLLGALIPVIAGVFYFTVNARGSDVPGHMVDVRPSRRADASDVAARAAGAQGHGDRSVSLMISVSARCQLQVVADGRQVLSRSLAAGELIRVNLDSDVVLLGDDAGAIHLSINGRAGRRLGDAGAPLNVRIARDDYHAWLIQP